MKNSQFSTNDVNKTIQQLEIRIDFVSEMSGQGLLRSLKAISGQIGERRMFSRSVE